MTQTPADVYERWQAGDQVEPVELARALRAALNECERLRGITPAIPPFPPDGDGLPRYGIRWDGPKSPLAVPMDDGYWTPWHLADAAVRDANSLPPSVVEALNSGDGSYRP
jgi:hypothetical protein